MAEIAWMLAGAADEFQLGQIKHEVFNLASQYGCELVLQFGRGRGVEAAGEFYRDGSNAFVANGLESQYFEWHISIYLLVFVCFLLYCKYIYGWPA